MKSLMKISRTAILGIALALLSVATAPPVAAQIIKPYGMAVPSFFFSGTEQRAREACAENRPECRASVRAQMEHEMAISLVIPWVLLGIGVLVVLFSLRNAERKKVKAAEAARRHHDPGKFRKLDREKSEQRNTDEDAEDLS